MKATFLVFFYLSNEKYNKASAFSHVVINRGHNSMTRYKLVLANLLYTSQQQKTTLQTESQLADSKKR